MKKLSVLLLGPPEIRWEQELVTIQRRYPRALLFYLASRGGFVGRQELLTLFWEDETETIARLRLRETLNKLKSSIPLPSLLISEGDLVGLDFDSVYVDQLEFRDLAHQWGEVPWRIPSGDPLPEQIFQVMIKSIRMWRGSHYLSGASFPSTPGIDDWLARNTQQTEHLRGRILERLSDHRYATGDLEQSLQLARLALENDELGYGLHERIIRLLVAMDHMAEARDHLKYYEHLSTSELPADSSYRLAALQQIITGGPGMGHPTSSMWNIRPSIQSPFIGRQGTIQQLRLAYQKGGAALISGESGLGKTRLVQEFTAQITPRPRLLIARCLPNEKTLPYQPIIDSIRYSIQEEEWKSLPAAWASQLLTIMPDLSLIRRDLEPPAPAAPDQARSLLFEATRQVILLLAQKQRLILFLDDIQWADKDTLDMITYLLERSPFDRQSLLILTLSSDEMTPSLSGLLHMIGSSPHASLIQLQRLTVPEIHKLVQAVLNKLASNPFIEQLASKTGGNPLFLLESLRALLEIQPEVDLQSLASFPLPPSLEQLIRSRLRLLSLRAKAVIDVAAVVGYEFNPALVATVTQTSQEQMTNALEELETTHLIEILRVTPPDLSYRFIHDQFREALLQDMNPMQLQSLHGKVARTLEKDLNGQTPVWPSVIAQHFEAVGEWKSAFHYWLEASLYAQQVYSIDEAYQAFDKTAHCLEKCSSQLTEKEIYQLYSAWNDLAHAIDDGPTLQRNNSSLLELTEKRSSPFLRGVALSGLAEASMEFGKFETALEQVDAAIVCFQTAGNRAEQVRTLVIRGIILYMLNRWEESREALHQALDLDPDSQDPNILKERTRANIQIAVLENLTGWPEPALAHAGKSLSLAVSLKSQQEFPATYNVLALSHYFLGHYRQAIENCQKGIEAAQKLRHPRMIGYLSTVDAMTRMSIGDLGGAEKAARRAIDTGEQLGHRELATLGYRLMGDLYAIQSCWTFSLEYFQRSLNCDQEGFWGLDNLLRYGYVLYLSGQAERGLDTVLKVLDSAKKIGLGIISIIGRVCYANILIGLGRWEEVKTITEKLIQEVQERSLSVWQTASISLLAEIALHQENYNEALKYYQDMVKQAAMLPNPWIEIKALVQVMKIKEILKQPVPDYRSHVADLLSQIEASLHTDTEAGIRSAYQKYRETILGYF